MGKDGSCALLFWSKGSQQGGLVVRTNQDIADDWRVNLTSALPKTNSSPWKWAGPLIKEMSSSKHPIFRVRKMWVSGSFPTFSKVAQGSSLACASNNPICQRRRLNSRMGPSLGGWEWWGPLLGGWCPSDRWLVEGGQSVPNHLQLD